MQYLRRRLSDGKLPGGGWGVGGEGAPSPRAPPPPRCCSSSPPAPTGSSSSAANPCTATWSCGWSRRVRPDFVLVRERPGGGAEGAPRRLLVALHLGGVPSSDPLPALYGFAHPPCLFAQLARLQRELGPEAFPLLPQRFCNRPRGLLTAPTFPMTVTLSPAPDGVGTVRVGSPEALGAVAGPWAGPGRGPWCGGAWGCQRLRVQRIGEEYRALRWPLVAGDSPGEGAPLEPVALSPRHRGWVDACARLFGGVDICGVEALRGPDGREHIVQVLGSWMPLVGPGAAEDRGRIVELVLARMRAELPRPRSPSPARPRPQMPATSGSPGRGPPQQRPPPQAPPPSRGGPRASAPCGRASPASSPTEGGPQVWGGPPSVGRTPKRAWDPQAPAPPA
ncbi:synapsin-1 [Ciconia boyciana]|uniref:synapsin-1 n=1 Tax=Ciconia boyciana TaxID=52775 RepID=UPI003BA1EE1B